MKILAVDFLEYIAFSFSINASMMDVHRLGLRSTAVESTNSVAVIVFARSRYRYNETARLRYMSTKTELVQSISMNHFCASETERVKIACSISSLSNLERIKSRNG